MKKINYHQYLKIDDLLSLQNLRSEEEGRPAHDELLFIIIHQVYELWFKQINGELDSALKVFSHDKVDEKDMGVIVARFERVIEIQKLLIQQIGVLETMTPLDFLDFRDLLYPASGFQSYQFREVENKLGLKPEDRIVYNQAPYHSQMMEKQQQQLLELQKQKSLFDLVETWLERTPFLNWEDFDFWSSYQAAVKTMFDNEQDIIANNDLLGDEDKKRNFKVLGESREVFSALFDEEKYNNLKDSGLWRLSYKAVHAALLIQLYRDQPVLHLPFRLITCLLNIDELMTTWRYRHALMVKRMLGTKVGTGGSSGFNYLRDTSEKHKVFGDLFQLTTFFIPRSALPELPENVQKRLGFNYEN